MSSAVTPAGPAHPDRALVWSLLGHGLLLALMLASGVVLHRAPPVSTLAIKATVVDRDAIPRTRSAPVEKPAPVPPAPPEEPRVDDDRAVLEQQQAAEKAKAEKVEAEKGRAEKIQAEQAMAESVKKREAAQVAAEKAAADKARADKAKAEKAKAEKAKAEKLKADQQKAEQAKADQEKAKAEARKAAQLKEKAAEAAAQRDIARQLAEEERLLAARDSGALDVYVSLIRQRVERNWVKPPGVQPGLECEVQVTQIPGGTVTGVRLGRCNGDEAVRRSIETAVLRASPLPLPDDPALFERNLLFTFKPEQ